MRTARSTWAGTTAATRGGRTSWPVTRRIAPPLIRWPGGCLTSYYRWREGVGPRRRPMRNILWGGMDSNRIGTHEFMDFCRAVGADPLLVVNFESDGRRHWARPASGGVRSAGPAEAAAWVRYCNDPGDAARRKNGAADPFGVRLWQIGNETSYDPNGFDCETAARRTVAFARAMRKRGPGPAPDRLGRQRLGAPHAGGRRRAPAVRRLPPGPALRPARLPHPR